jgi:hypothetical protein
LNQEHDPYRLDAGEPRPDLHHIRACLLLDAGERLAALTELVRALLLSEEIAFLVSHRRLRRPLARLVPSLERWARLALEAVKARLDGETLLERRLLLEALREAPEERSIFLSLCRLERGSASDLEVFALEEALEGSDWPDGHLRLAQAYREREEFARASRTLHRLLDQHTDFLDARRALADLDRFLNQQRRQA